MKKLQQNIAKESLAKYNRNKNKAQGNTDTTRQVVRENTWILLSSCT
jgi:hypothetical protein